MGHNSSGLHLRIAEWILERGEAACVYDVTQQFGVTIHQAIGLLSAVVMDSAIETKTGLLIPDRPNDCCNSKHVRSVFVLSIDYEIISLRKKAHRRDTYHAKSHQPETNGEMSRAEKWDWVIRNGGRRKR